MVGIGELTVQRIQENNGAARMQLESFLKQRKMRYKSVDGVLWVVAKDACNVLGWANPRQVIARNVSTENKRMIAFVSGGGSQQMSCINEPGFYQLVLKSKSQIADSFRENLAKEVLPAIRQEANAISQEKTIEQMPDVANAVTLANSIIELGKELNATNAAEVAIETVKTQYGIDLNQVFKKAKKPKQHGFQYWDKIEEFVRCHCIPGDNYYVPLKEIHKIFNELSGCSVSKMVIGSYMNKHYKRIKIQKMVCYAGLKLDLELIGDGQEPVNGRR